MSLSDRSVVKAHRLVGEGRVRELTAERRFVVAGDHDTYLVTVSVDGATCSCPAYVAHCSHVEAVLLAIGGRPPARRPSPGAAAQIDHGREQAPPGRLFTWYGRAALDTSPAGVTLVRISLSRPRWVPASRSAEIPYVHELAPAGDLFNLDGPEFDRRYRERLDGSGVARIERRLRAVAAANGGLPLVLLCFERGRADYHRDTFATWSTEQTGEVVPELSADVGPEDPLIGY